MTILPYQVPRVWIPFLVMVIGAALLVKLLAEVISRWHPISEVQDIARKVSECCSVVALAAACLILFPYIVIL